jgi:hypothetical protein
MEAEGLAETDGHIAVAAEVIVDLHQVSDGADPCGQHIDIFILDPVPSDPEAQAEYKKYATVYSELMTPVYVLCDEICQYMDLYEQYRQMMEQEVSECYDWAMEELWQEAKHQA